MIAARHWSAYTEPKGITTQETAVSIYPFSTVRKLKVTVASFEVFRIGIAPDSVLIGYDAAYT